MYIGLHNIQGLFSDSKSLLIRADSRYCLTGWLMLKNAPRPYATHLLYITDNGDDLRNLPLIPDMHILYLTPENTDLESLAGTLPSSLNLLLIATDDHNHFYSELQSYFDTQCGIGQFCHTLLEILSFEGGIQAMVDHSYMVFENPVFVFDASFNLIAANWEEARKYNAGIDIILNKGFSEREFKIANNNHIHEKMRKSDVPILVHHEEIGYDQLICTIDTEKDMGHVVISAVNRPFRPVDSPMLWVLKKYIDQQMKKDEFIRNSKGFNYEYFLKDLLDGKIATARSFLDRMNYVDAEFSGNMYCLVVETARSSSTLNTYHIRNLFENRFPNTKTLLYNGEIIIILNTPANHLLQPSQLETATQICIENGLYAGMSNSFQNILDLAEYYKQALRAIELGICTSNEPNLFLYKDYILDHVKNIFLQKESPNTFCHPKMKFLLDYDKEHKSELAYTLYMYLVHERNIAAASAAMNMHRTSLVYRFKKIYSLIGDDFEDYRDRQYLILSYEMNKGSSD